MVEEYRKHIIFKVFIALLLFVSLVIFGVSCKASPSSDNALRLVEPIRIVTTTKEYDAVRYQSAHQIAQWWSELGLTVVVEPMEFRDLMVRIRDQKPQDKDWEAFMLLWTGRVERADPDMFIYSIAHSSQAVESGNNISAYTSEEYDALAEAQRRIADPELRRTVVHAAQEVLAKDIPYITLFYRYIHSAYRTDLLYPIPAMAGEGLFHEWLPYYVRFMAQDQPLHLVVAGNQEPAALNPLTATTVWEWKLLRYMYDKLARVNQSFRPEPWAAQSITYINDQTIEVILRPDMVFHDGMPVTAKDVKFSFEFMKEQNVAYFNAFISPIESIDVAEDLKIIFTLKEPYAPFLTMSLAQIPILPMHLWEKWALDVSQPIPMIGSGPLIFNEWQVGESIRFSKNKRYFASADMELDTFEYRILDSFEAIVASIKSGESHITGAYLDPGSIPKLEGLETIGLVQSPDIGFYIFGLNCYREPFNDRALREAVARATDLEYLVKTVIDGYGDVGGAGQPISTGNPYWRNNQVSTYPFDVNEARRVLEEAGYLWDTEGKLAYPAHKAAK
jgi:peptide/nickel transport system substrate-binding protein